MKDKVQVTGNSASFLRLFVFSLMVVFLKTIGLFVSGLAIGVWVIPYHGVFPMLTVSNLAISVALMISGLCCLAIARHLGGR